MYSLQEFIISIKCFNGIPVIFFGKGGTLETVISGKTGIFFEEQTVESLNSVIEKFEKTKFDFLKIRKNAEKFDKKVFQKKFLDFIK